MLFVSPSRVMEGCWNSDLSGLCAVGEAEVAPVDTPDRRKFVARASENAWRAVTVSFCRQATQPRRVRSGRALAVCGGTQPRVRFAHSCRSAGSSYSSPVDSAASPGLGVLEAENDAGGDLLRELRCAAAEVGQSAADDVDRLVAGAELFVVGVSPRGLVLGGGVESFALADRSAVGDGAVLAGDLGGVSSSACSGTAAA